jgi:hypothetical protein
VCSIQSHNFAPRSCSSGTMSSPFPFTRKSLILVSVRTSIFFCVSHVTVPICGRSVAFGKSRSRGLTAGSSGYTSSPTAPNFQSHKPYGHNNAIVKRLTCPSSSVLISAASSMTFPLAVFTRTAPFLSFRIIASSTRPSVSGLRGT